MVLHPEYLDIDLDDPDPVSDALNKGLKPITT